MMEALGTQLLSLATGLLAVTSMLLVWRRSLTAAVRLLALQGVGLALLVVAIAFLEDEWELLLVAAVVLGVKAIAIPIVLGRAARTHPSGREESPLLNPTASLVMVALLTGLAFLASAPITAGVTQALGGEVAPAAGAAPLGLAMVLIGALMLATRRRALSQIAGFLMLDNGIATVGFVTSSGVPLIVELGVSLDVLLIAVILAILTGRMQAVLGDYPIGEMAELRD